MAFEPPAADEVPSAPPDLEPMEFQPPGEAHLSGAAPDADLAAQPFDSQLAWGTGQRVSGKVSQADVEAAERAHEASLEPVVQEPSPSTDLPLIFPEDVTPAAAQPAPREPEPGAGAVPEPVLTETMAELYAKQGLATEARDIYRKLVAQRPGDAALAARLDALEAAPGGRRASGARVAAAGTGGPSARDFLSQVFGGEGAKASSSPLPAAPVAQGAPTRRASDEVSLASVFGEEPQPIARPAAGPPGEPKPAGQGFSFDEFFGGERGSTGRPASSPPPAAGGDQGGEDDDDFKRWLKGLKS